MRGPGNRGGRTAPPNPNAQGVALGQVRLTVGSDVTPVQGRSGSTRGFFAGPQPLAVAGQNFARNGFIIQNLDAVNPMFISLMAASDQANAFRIPPTGQLSVDFAMPETIWAFCAPGIVSVQGVIFESSGFDFQTAALLKTSMRTEMLISELLEVFRGKKK